MIISHPLYHMRWDHNFLAFFKINIGDEFINLEFLFLKKLISLFL